MDRVGRRPERQTVPEAPAFGRRVARAGGPADPEVCRVPEGAPLRFMELKGREGKRLGDVKIPALETGVEWRDILGVGSQVEVCRYRRCGELEHLGLSGRRR